jgi:hypothetical protein
VVTLLVLTALLAIESQGTAGPAGAEAQVRAAEAARIEATVANDFEALDRLLGDDLTYTHTNAQIDTKQTFLAALRTGRTRYQSIEPSDVQVRMYGQGCHPERPGEGALPDERAAGRDVAPVHECLARARRTLAVRGLAIHAAAAVGGESRRFTHWIHRFRQRPTSNAQVPSSRAVGRLAVGGWELGAGVVER